MTKEYPDFDYIRSLVKGTAGISMQKGKEYLIENRLSPLSRERGFESVGAFIAEIQNEDNNAELTDLAIDALTINETSFFRDDKTYEWLKNSVIPDILEKNQHNRQLSIWSGASSTGQEIYSLAILLKEEFPHISHWNIQLTASDISERVLSQAREGVYTDFELGRGMSSELQGKYFDRISDYDWKIKDEIRDMVHFEKRNLIKPWHGLKKFDLILLRNVLIYFEQAEKQAILKKLKKQIMPNGHLILGSSETTYNLDNDWGCKLQEQSCSYQLKDDFHSEMGI